MRAGTIPEGGPPPATTVWDTDGVARAERFAFWREAVCDAFLELAPETSAPVDFHGSIVLQQRSSVSVALISADAQRVARPRASDGGWCYLNVQVAGTARTVQGETVVTARPGDAVLLRTDRPFRFELDGPFVQYSVRLPESFGALIDEPVSVPGASGLGRAVASLVALTGLHDAAVHSVRDAAADAVRDSAVDAIAAGSGPDDLGDWLDRSLLTLSGRVVEAASRAPWTADRWWPAVDADIDRHLHSSSLSPSDTARRVGLSVRAVHHTFDDHPLTFAREVKRRRLERAHAMLIDPSFDGLRIRDVAADCGFDDVQHFQRVFRAHFGDTPGRVRGSVRPGPSSSPPGR